MTYSHEVEHMCVVTKGPNHGPAPIPEEGKWVKAKESVDISGLTHGIGWCAPDVYKRQLKCSFVYSSWSQITSVGSKLSTVVRTYSCLLYTSRCV